MQTLMTCKFWNCKKYENVIFSVSVIFVFYYIENIFSLFVYFYVRKLDNDFHILIQFNM